MSAPTNVTDFPNQGVAVSAAPPKGSYPLDDLLATKDVDLTCPAGTTPADPTNAQAGPTSGAYGRYVRVEGAGTVKFVAFDGSVDTWTFAAADVGQVYPLVALYVYKTGTSATGVRVLT
jgi:hypothetical protein